MPLTARGQRTRQLILERTAHVFDQQGYAGATLNLLVASTGLTRGAFYFHFESKDALAAAIAEEQARRWQQLRRRVEHVEADPLRRLVTLVSSAAVAFRDDPTVRATSRLLLDRSLIRCELPQTAPWWRDTLEQLLLEAERAGLLRDLSFLHRSPLDGDDSSAGAVATAACDAATPGSGTSKLAAYLVSQLANIGQAARARPDSQFDLLYMQWAIVLPRICRDEGHGDELLALARSLLSASAPATTPGSSPAEVPAPA
jgi:AcrR family transcriptional regulator